MKLVVIDGQSGRVGALLVERVRAAGLPLEQAYFRETNTQGRCTLALKEEIR